jgi:hypothetical protein
MSRLLMKEGWLLQHHTPESRALPEAESLLQEF